MCHHPQSFSSCVGVFGQTLDPAALPLLLDLLLVCSATAAHMYTTLWPPGAMSHAEDTKQNLLHCQVHVDSMMIAFLVMSGRCCYPTAD